MKDFQNDYNYMNIQEALYMLSYFWRTETIQALSKKNNTPFLILHRHLHDKQAVCERLNVKESVCTGDGEGKKRRIQRTKQANSRHTSHNMNTERGRDDYSNTMSHCSTQLLKAEQIPFAYRHVFAHQFTLRCIFSAELSRANCTTCVSISMQHKNEYTDSQVNQMYYYYYVK